MEMLSQIPDNYYALAIVDPPYGIGMHKQRVYNDGKKWDTQRPDASYFIELQRVSVNQIVWGGNYFSELWPNKGFIIWDKHQPEGISFAMVELATCTIDRPAKMFFTKTAGERGFYTVDCKRIHPTQKPVKLYEWLLKNYAKPGDTILDTHLGSGSIAIACHNMGHQLTGFELDKHYYDAARQRIEGHVKQEIMFK